MNWTDTCKVIPEGVQALSKRPCVHVEGVYPNWMLKGRGAYVWDEAGKMYIDYPCSLGAVVLGHCFEPVVRALREQIDEGTLFSLSHPKETELAELLRDTIPSIEMVRFLKTGSEACSAAVRIARAYTGRASIICCGYHGWHNWFNCTTPKNAGSVPQDVTPVTWGDLRKLEELLTEKKPAAFITEPYVYEDEKMVEKWLKEARRLCDIHKVILIFDENVTGFRTKKLSAQAYWKVTPDLTCLGKAMGNGVPIAAVGGKREIMDVLTKDCFVSSTFGGDLLGISAAIATVSYLKSHPAIEHIWTMGSKLKSSFNMIATSMIAEGVRCIGLPPRTHFIFPTAAHKSLFWQECLKQGVFFGHAQFVSFAHKMPELDKTLMAVRQALHMVRKHWEKPEEILQGKVAGETLRMVTVPVVSQLKSVSTASSSAIPETVPHPFPITEPEMSTTDEIPPKRKPGRPRKVKVDET